MNTSSKGIALIKSFEKCKLRAYNDGVGIWTIGWGSTRFENGTKVQPGDVITQERADSLFRLTLPKYEKVVNDLLKVEVNQDEFDALVCFTYNTGGGYVSKTTKKWTPYELWAYVNKSKPIAEIVAKFKSTATTGGGKRLDGLIKRRIAEATLFESGVLMLHK